MERLKRLDRLTPSQLLSIREIVDVDEISDAHRNDEDFFQATQTDLQRISGWFLSSL